MDGPGAVFILSGFGGLLGGKSLALGETDRPAGAAAGGDFSGRFSSWTGALFPVSGWELLPVYTAGWCFETGNCVRKGRGTLHPAG